jgi:mannose-1-phosphate guanylyltransferase / mannose-6-phosphate isomerase
MMEKTITERKWGSWEVLQVGERFKVKRLVIEPGHGISLQQHLHRSEHWVIVQGTAEVRIGNVTRLLTEDQGTYVPLGTIHKLINPGKIPLVIIEVQSGSYLEEDDIIRLSETSEATLILDA